MLTRFMCLAIAAFALTTELAVAETAKGTAVVAANALSAPPARPPSLANSLKGAAKTEYESGKLLYEDGDFSGAALKFQRAYELSGDARLLWNRAAAEKNLRHYAQVRTLVRQYLAKGGPLVSADERADAEALIAMVQAFVSEVTVRVDQPDADISIDGRAVGKSPLPNSISLDLGEHEVRASKA
ncbi:MAG: PEGA domain-containing protein [Myxococcales bacterium]|nr:MAG: PEGA domain-containing protein [Myxococcales bacterium]